MGYHQAVRQKLTTQKPFWKLTIHLYKMEDSKEAVAFSGTDMDLNQQYPSTLLY